MDLEKQKKKLYYVRLFDFDLFMIWAQLREWSRESDEKKNNFNSFRKKASKINTRNEMRIKLFETQLNFTAWFTRLVEFSSRIDFYRIRIKI